MFQNWPDTGAVVFNNVTMSYRENSPVLIDVSLAIKAGERIGVCGRTGAGKSSLYSIFNSVFFFNSKFDLLLLACTKAVSAVPCHVVYITLLDDVC